MEIQLNVNKMELVAMKESLQLMKYRLETKLGGNTLGAPETIEHVGNLITKLDNELIKFEEPKQPTLTTPTENDCKIICPKCGSTNAYGNLAGEWCEDCDYDTITEY